jgi:hypothetical protein
MIFTARITRIPSIWCITNDTEPAKIQSNNWHASTTIDAEDSALVIAKNDFTKAYQKR